MLDEVRSLLSAQKHAKVDDHESYCFAISSIHEHNLQVAHVRQVPMELDYSTSGYYAGYLIRYSAFLLTVLVTSVPVFAALSRI